MAPALLDESSFDSFVSIHDTAVIWFIEQNVDAAEFSTLARAVAAKYPGVAFARVGAGSRTLFETFGIAGNATAIFRERVGMYLEPGFPAAELLDRLLFSITALDMEHVRSELAQEKAARESLAVHRVCPAMRRGKL
jgi:hypothetical protein